jgi:hypothetical protein
MRPYRNFVEESAAMDGNLCRGAREKGGHINEGPGYIYCVSSRNKVRNVMGPEKRVSHQ